MRVRLGFTGSETAPDPGRLVDRVIRNLPNVFPDVAEVTTGGAAGVDHQAFFSARYAYPNPEKTIQRLALPRGFRYTEALEREQRRAAETFGAESFPIVLADGPLKRNDVIVAESDVLVAFPETGAEKQRSGTWSTIRRARKKGIPIFVFPLDGSDAWVEGGTSAAWEAFIQLRRRLGLSGPSWPVRRLDGLGSR